jgi:glucokinase
MAKSNIVVGVDIGGTNTKLGFVTEQGECIKEARFKTLDYLQSNKFFIQLVKSIKERYGNLEKNYNLVGIGIGAPNGNYYRKTIENPPNLPWGVIDVEKILKKSFDVRVALTNDANAAAIGEQFFGSGKGMKDFIMITLGTGLGSGIIVNGQLVHGYDGFAGELGHINYERNGRQCTCGLKGCLEAYASGSGIVRTAKELLIQPSVKSNLRKYSDKKLTSELIYKEALKGDIIALQCFELTGKALGSMLADAVAVTNPEAIFLFGGLAKAGDLIIKPTKKYLKENLFTPFIGKVKVLQSGLTNVNAAVLGSAALILEELKD